MLLLLLTTLALAAPSLALPVDCEIGLDCWISSRPDVDPGPGFRDHAGSAHSYDAHSGTDVAVRGTREAAVTWVRAPAAGRVLRVRDGVPDGKLLATGSDDPACGNGLVMALDEGWELQLCHLLWGSVVVAPGEPVAAGQPLGRVGMSGETDHPHVHLTVMHQGRKVDPFSGLTLDTAEPAAPGPLWAAPVPDPREQDALAWAGFRPGRRDGGQEWPVDTGVAVLPEDANDMSLVIFLWRPQAGDIVRTAIRAPNGKFKRSKVVQKRDRPRQVFTIERDWRPRKRPTGLWTAVVSWERDGRVRRVTTTVVVP